MNPQGALKGRYATMVTYRDPYLRRGRECSKLTIPTLVPEEGSNGTTKFYQPFQSLGARGVNNLAAKLLLTLLPPNAPFFRLTIDDFMLEKLTKREGMRAQVEEALNRIERSVMNEVETTAIRPAIFEALKHLIVAGNVLLHVLPEGGMKVFRLDRYVVKRDPAGNVLEIMTAENVSPIELPEQVQKIVLAHRTESKQSMEDSVEVYTQVKRSKDGGWTVKQEVMGFTVPGSEGTYPEGKCPWLALRFIIVDGEDYGRSYVEEYLGDLKSLEGLTKAIVQGAAAAAKVLFLVKPNSTTKQKVLAESESGAIREGNAQDVSVLQLEKYADFRVARETKEGIEKALAYAFLLNSAIQRNGERVTAEEIKLMAAELEAALGGIYAMLAQEFQLPLVSVLMHNMERKRKLPVLPKGVVKPAVVTGVEAIGRGEDRARMRAFLEDLQAGGEHLLQELNGSDLVKRIGVSHMIDMKGLVKTEEQKAAEAQQRQMQQMIDRLGPNAVNKFGDIARDQMNPNNPNGA